MLVPGSAASRTSSNQKQPLLSIWVESLAPGWNVVKCLIASSHHFETPSSLDIEFLSKWCEPVSFLEKKSVQILGWCLGGKKKEENWMIKFYKLNKKQLCLHPVDTPIGSKPSYPKLGLGPRTVWKLCGSSFMAASNLSALDCCPGWQGSSRF